MNSHRDPQKIVLTATTDQGRPMPHMTRLLAKKIAKWLSDEGYGATPYNGAVTISRWPSPVKENTQIEAGLRSIV